MARRRGGYLIYVIRAHIPRRPRRLLRLSDVDGEGTDVLERMCEHLTALGPGLHRSSDDEGFRVREVAPVGRTMFIRVRQGPLGSPGEYWDMDLEVAQELTDRQPALSELRGFVAIPRDAHFGLLFVERVARRHVRDIVRDNCLIPISHETGAVIRTAAFAEGGDWRVDLADKQPLRVSEMLERRSTSHSNADFEETTIRTTVEGGGLRARGELLKERFVRRADRSEQRLRLLLRASTVEDDAEVQALIDELDAQERDDAGVSGDLAGLVPEAPPGFEHKQWTVQFGERRPERTFVLERESMPQFVYELGSDRLSDSALRQTWRSHAERIFRDFGEPTPQRWAQGQWGG